MNSPQRMPRKVGMTASPIGRFGNIGKQDAKYLVVLTEGGVAPVERRMPHTIAGG